MNQWGGAGYSKELGLWNNRADANQPFVFVSVEEFQANSNVLPLIPYPNSVKTSTGKLQLSALKNIVVPETETAALRYANEFAEQLNKIAGISLSVNGSASDAAITFTVNSKLAHEAYTLKTSESGITITSADSTGFFYALQTLKQLMPHAIYGTNAAASLDWSVPFVEITDKPQFGHRGYMLDVARHFFSKKEVMRILDVMASYKMNRFHWHLTDDQGWRIEIPEYPKLTEVGAIRKASFSNAGGSSSFYDDTEYGRGMYFTLDDLKEIVAYAKARNIEIMPEVDLPGHMVAAVTSYPEFSCDPTKTYEVRVDGGISKDVLNVGKDEVIDFLKCVLGHLAEVFPYQYIHLGGDECPTDQWKNNADCLKRVKDEGLSGVDQLQSWLVEKLGIYLKEKYNKDIVCWDELLSHWKSDNTVKPVIMAWNNISKSADAANKGFKSIVVPYQSLYLDMMQVPLSRVDINEKYQGGWGDNWVNTVETVYGVNPVSSLSGREQYCLGVQGNMWTETCNDSVEVEYQLLPRMLALSETGWLPASKKNWTNFYLRLQKNRDILDAKGLTYATHYFEDPDLTASETALEEAKDIIEKSISGGVGYPSQAEYEKLNNAYEALKADANNADKLTALNAAIESYKNADIVLPQAGKNYKLVSASTYYKAKYVGSTAYTNGSTIRFHYTPQTEPEELWQFTPKDGGYIATNMLNGKQIAMPATTGNNVTLEEKGTTLTLAKATKASGKYTYVPGAVTLSANGLYFTADCTGLVKAGENDALCYQGTWYVVEVTDYAAQLSGLVKKASNIVRDAKPGEMGEPTEEAIDLLSEELITPATTLVNSGVVSEADYNKYVAIYNQYLAMPKLSPAQTLSEDYYYFIRNAYFTAKYAVAETGGAVKSKDKGTTSGYYWRVKKNANGTVTIINRLTDKAAYPASDAETAKLLTGTKSYEWVLNVNSTDEGNTGIQILSNSGTYSWYTNPSVWQEVILKPKEWGASIWTFEQSNIETAIDEVKTNEQTDATYYDLQGRKVEPNVQGVYVTSKGKKVVK